MNTVKTLTSAILIAFAITTAIAQSKTEETIAGRDAPRTSAYEVSTKGVHYE
jgi:hypothetical protein